MSRPLLEADNLTVHYGAIQALRGVSCRLEAGEMVAVIGANGAGKTTFLRALTGLSPVSGGAVRLEGEDLTRLPAEQRVARGMALVPEGRKLFRPLSVAENLRLGTYTLRRKQSPAERARNLEKVYSLFPVLYERRKQKAGTLSGGQQQMLAIGRALMSSPRLLLLDEPSLGLAPKVVDDIFDALLALNRSGLTAMFVEQNAVLALDVSHRCYIFAVGRVVLEGLSSGLRDNDEVISMYLGGHPSAHGEVDAWTPP